MLPSAMVTLLLGLLPTFVTGACVEHNIDFILKDTDPEGKVVEDDMREDLKKIGVNVNTVLLDAAGYSEAERHGDYHMMLSRTWGAPYDPHTYINSWAAPSHVEYSALGNLVPPLTRDSFLQKVEDVIKTTDENQIHEAWKEILNDIHQQAIFLPLWGSRIPYVINRRLSGFKMSNQAFTYPLKSVSVLNGSTTVNVAPGTSGSLFTTAGELNPHLYAPNQIFVSDWIYEGLVAYGQDGAIMPALAEDWTIEDTAQGQKATFKLRKNVTFHDGSEWNCAVAKLNFDHVLSDTVRQRHGWYETAAILKSWTCTAAGDFVLETSQPFYPLLQELTYVRPLRFASAAAFKEGLDSDPDLHNSCTPGGFGSSYTDLEKNVTCVGLSAPVGTGPFKFVSREAKDSESDASVTFARHDSYWGQRPGIQTLVVKNYESSDAVYDALKKGELDMALGTGPLTPVQIEDVQLHHSAEFEVLRSEPFQNALLILNANKAPTNDINVRKAIVHSINKAGFIDKEFAGLKQPASQLLPLTAPYCDVDLNPKWDFDLEKATLLNCPSDSEGASSLSKGAIAGISVACVVLAAVVGLMAAMVVREKRGKPIFAPYEEMADIEATKPPAINKA